MDSFHPIHRGRRIIVWHYCESSERSHHESTGHSSRRCVLWHRNDWANLLERRSGWEASGSWHIWASYCRCRCECNEEWLFRERNYSVCSVTCRKSAPPEEMKNIPQSCPVVAVVDPARDGLHGIVIRTLRSNERIQRLVYVSCNPTGTFSPRCCNAVQSTNEEVSG